MPLLQQRSSFYRMNQTSKGLNFRLCLNSLKKIMRTKICERQWEQKFVTIVIPKLLLLELEKDNDSDKHLLSKWVLRSTLTIVNHYCIFEGAHLVSYRRDHFLPSFWRDTCKLNNISIRVIFPPSFWRDICKLNNIYIRVIWPTHTCIFSLITSYSQDFQVHQLRKNFRHRSS